MKNRIAPVKNIKLLSQAGEALRARVPTAPGIALVWGPTGAGKTTAAAWYANQVDAICIRATATWTPSAMLAALCRELEMQPLSSSSRMLDAIAQQLSKDNRPLFIDEADYLMSTKKLSETVRDIHDISLAPLILIGMAELKRKVIHREQLAGRVGQWVEFGPATFEDAKSLAKHVCEVEVDDDLMQQLYEIARGSMRHMVVGLSHIENYARLLGSERMTSEQWGERDFVLPGINAGKRAAA